MNNSKKHIGHRGRLLCTGELNYVPNAKGLGFEIYHCMKEFSDRIAQYLVDSDKSDTYESLLKRCVRTTLKLKSLGITKEDIISICTDHHENSFVPFIATHFLCARVASLDTSMSVAESKHFLGQVKATIIFVAESSVPIIETALNEANLGTKIVVFGRSDKYSTFEDFLKPHAEEENFVPASVEDIFQTAVILFSSGTTGVPKGICLSHYSIMSQAVGLPSSDDQEGFGISNYKIPSRKGIVSLLYSSLYWISCVQYTIRIIFTGAAKVICSKYDPEKIWSLFGKYKVTYALITPIQAIQMLKAKKLKNIDTSSLQVIFTGSTTVSEKLMNDLKSNFPKTCILQAYGQTEAGGMVTLFTREDNYLQEKNPLSCGRLIRNLVAKVVDPETEEILGPNEKGEMRYKGKCLMNGYHNRDSSGAFDADGFLKTGDIVYYDENDCFYVCGRMKEIFKYQGWHMIPLILEEILLKHPAVKEAVVIGVPHPEDGDHAMGVVVLNDKSSNVTGEEIEKFFESRVEERQRLRAGVKIVKEIPKTVTGKSNRVHVRQLILNGEM